MIKYVSCWHVSRSYGGLSVGRKKYSVKTQLSACCPHTISPTKAKNQTQYRQPRALTAESDWQLPIQNTEASYGYVTVQQTPN